MLQLEEHVCVHATLSNYSNLGELVHVLTPNSECEEKPSVLLNLDAAMC